MGSGHRRFGWVAVTVAIIGFLYYVIRGVTASQDLTRLLPHLGMSLGVFAMGVHFLIRSRHERSATVFLNTGLLLFCVSAITAIAQDIMNNQP
ncbi:MAG: hypothetical protein M3R24_42295 [Chloroflexota bacterium]|nr:hypothetical protein [Chloroflexota bacterium]